MQNDTYLLHGIQLCSLAQNDHAHSRCVARQSFRCNLLRKCGIVYGNEIILWQPTDCIPENLLNNWNGLFTNTTEKTECFSVQKFDYVHMPHDYVQPPLCIFWLCRMGSWNEIWNGSECTQLQLTLVTSSNRAKLPSTTTRALTSLQRLKLFLICCLIWYIRLPASDWGEPERAPITSRFNPSVCNPSVCNPSVCSFLYRRNDYTKFYLPCSWNSRQWQILLLFVV